MSDLKLPEVHWDEIEAFELDYIRSMSIQERMQEYFDLMSATWMWRPEVEADYQAEREAMLIELQRRLRVIGEYEAQHGSTLGIISEASATAE